MIPVLRAVDDARYVHQDAATLPYSAGELLNEPFSSWGFPFRETLL
jgi:hypothetical protein